jgi:hypothetical protein
VLTGSFCEGDLAEVLSKALADQEALQHMFEAINRGDVPAVRHALKECPHLLTQGVRHHKSGNAPLHMACSVGSTELVKELLDAGAHIQQTDSQDRTPLKVQRPHLPASGRPPSMPTRSVHGHNVRLRSKRPRLHPQLRVSLR